MSIRIGKMISNIQRYFYFKNPLGPNPQAAHPFPSLFLFLYFLRVAQQQLDWPNSYSPAPPALARSGLLHSGPSPFRGPTRCPDPLPPGVRNQSRGSFPDSYSPWRPTPKSYWTQTKSMVGDRRSLESLRCTS
jgi:hypothetical protein